MRIERFKVKLLSFKLPSGKSFPQISIPVVIQTPTLKLQRLENNQRNHRQNECPLAQSLEPRYKQSMAAPAAHWPSSVPCQEKEVPWLSAALLALEQSWGAPGTLLTEVSAS